MEALQIIASSWPFAIMFVALIGGVVLLKIVNWRKRVEENNIAYRAEQALVVRNRER